MNPDQTCAPYETYLQKYWSRRELLRPKDMSPACEERFRELEEQIRYDPANHFSFRLLFVGSLQLLCTGATFYGVWMLIMDSGIPAPLIVIWMALAALCGFCVSHHPLWKEWRDPPSAEQLAREWLWTAARFETAAAPKRLEPPASPPHFGRN